ncbi:chromosome partitioning protein [Cetobacterium ceti]|uniref:Chromosome partitioning protein n=1 Tax=Cetobacterium ceti TaxID=180163 RepID=A0A1T4R3F8_9FUSO|nr:ParA family protein [Cetobacterium ceti]SKA10387.1 chromosome partitioning protein [Cetobacterium ceti]
MGKIYTVKVNKGGVGKTFLTTQLADGLAKGEKKVLILTSDSQNNILNYTFPYDNKPIFNNGLKALVKTGEGDIIKLRDNLYFIPLEDNKFSPQFIKTLPEVIEKLKKEYDFIFIDSIPTMQIDSVFVKCSDKIIIPSFCDPVTLEGILNVIDEIGPNKIHSIVTNLYRNTETQKRFYNELKDILAHSKIKFFPPIKELSAIETLLSKGKTVWESEAKDLQETQDILLEIISSL